MGAIDNIVAWWTAAQGRAYGLNAASVPVEPPPPQHPYYPQDIMIAGYVENETPLPVLLASFSGMLGSVLLAANVLALKLNPRLTASNLAAVTWFVLCGSLHCFFEAYYISHYDTIASSQHIFAQLWKEYALSDSRYLRSDPFMLCVEAITVFILGPLAFACAATTIWSSPLRHLLRIILSVAYLYGLVLYYSISLSEEYLTGRSDSRPEFVYFWVYFIGFNIPWAIVPFFMLRDSIKTITKSVRTVDRMGATLDNSGAVQNGAGGTENKKTN